jgi:hypothetical protein
MNFDCGANDDLTPRICSFHHQSRHQRYFRQPHANNNTNLRYYIQFVRLCFFVIFATFCAISFLTHRSRPDLPDQRLNA